MEEWYRGRVFFRGDLRALGACVRVCLPAYLPGEYYRTLRGEVVLCNMLVALLRAVYVVLTGTLLLPGGVLPVR